MALPREYRKFIGNYSGCKNAYGRKMLRKFGYGPKTEIVQEEIVKEVVKEVKPVEEVKPKKTRKTKKKTTK